MEEKREEPKRRGRPRQVLTAVKTCTKCKQTKMLEHFSHRYRRGPVVYASKCKACTAAYSRERYETKRKEEIERTTQWRKDHPERVKTYRAKHAEATRQYMREDREKRPEIWAARRAVNNAIACGKMERLPCEVCGAVRTEGHHESYEPENWLKVRWLCRKHHVEAHKN